MFTQGSVAPGFEKVAEAFAANFEDGLELGASFAAIVDGETVVELWGGYADRAKQRLWDRDTLTPVYSTTKGIAALVVARLVDQGKLDYEAPVADVWPAFAANGKAHITLAQTLSHQAGLCGFREEIDPALWLDPPALAAALAPLEPLWPPGNGERLSPADVGLSRGRDRAARNGKIAGPASGGRFLRTARRRFLDRPARRGARALRRDPEAEKPAAARRRDRAEEDRLPDQVVCARFAAARCGGASRSRRRTGTARRFRWRNSITSMRGAENRTRTR